MCPRGEEEDETVMGCERMKDSDVLRDLISLDFDRDPADAEITLRDCLDLLSRTVAAEQSAKMFKNIEGAANAYSRERTVENAERLYE